MEVMNNIRPSNAFVQDICEDTKPSAPRTLQRTAAERVFKICLLATYLHEMRKDVKERVSARRRRAVDAHNEGTNIVIPYFNFGDSVVAYRAEKTADKFAFMWSGRRKVIIVKSPTVCVVDDLLTQERDNVHVFLFRNYFAVLGRSRVPDEVLDLFDYSAAMYEVVNKIVDTGEAADSS